jgi:hypothetical protein
VGAVNTLPGAPPLPAVVAQGLQMMQGTSLRPLLTNFSTYTKPFAMSQYARSFSPDPRFYMGYALRTIRFRYIRWTVFQQNLALAEELYDLSVDPGETLNVVNKANYTAQLTTLRGLFAAYFSRQPLPAVPFDLGQSNEDAAMQPRLSPQLPDPQATSAPTPEAPRCAAGAPCMLVQATLPFAVGADVAGAHPAALLAALARALQSLVQARGLGLPPALVVELLGGSAGGRRLDGAAASVQFGVGQLAPDAATALARFLGVDWAFFKFGFEEALQAALADAGVFAPAALSANAQFSPVVLDDGVPVPTALPTSAANSPTAFPHSGAPTVQTPSAPTLSPSAHPSQAPAPPITKAPVPPTMPSAGRAPAAADGLGAPLLLLVVCVGAAKA